MLDINSTINDLSLNIHKLNNNFYSVDISNKIQDISNNINILNNKILDVLNIYTRIESLDNSLNNLS